VVVGIYWVVGTPLHLKLFKNSKGQRGKFLN